VKRLVVVALGLAAAAAGAEAPAGPFLRAVGTVQDGGLPHAGCTCDRCEIARRDPARKRHVASLALVLPAGKKVFLIDATPDLREQLDALADVRDAPAGRTDRAPLDGVLLTHAHMGHYLGLAFLGYEAIHTSQVPVWGTPRMCSFLRANGPWSQLVEKEEIALRELADGATVEVGEGVRVTAVRAPHRDEFADTIGFRIAGPRHTVLYVPDTDSWLAWGDRLATALEGVDVAILDGTFFSGDELPGRDVTKIGHPLMTDTVERLGPRVAAGTLRVYFTHLNHSNPALEAASTAAKWLQEKGFAVLAEGEEIGL
jgi:pyrroloquinoline quinone biosynthesis protein B